MSRWDVNSHWSRLIIKKGGKVIRFVQKVHLLTNNGLMTAHPFSVFAQRFIRSTGKLVEDLGVSSQSIVILLELHKDSSHEFETASGMLIERSRTALPGRVETTASSKASTVATVLFLVVEVLKDLLKLADFILKMEENTMVEIVEAAIHGIIWGFSQMVRKMGVSKSDWNGSKGCATRNERTSGGRMTSGWTRLSATLLGGRRAIFRRWKAVLLFSGKAGIDRWGLTGMRRVASFHAGFRLDINLREWLHSTAGCASELGRRRIRKVGTEHGLLVGSYGVASSGLCGFRPTLIVVTILSEL
ncbi:hypothetical protein AA313_de0202114 [Arthrobotrys entomopaga]|nr:hypothetical protein AA313_de0202114 [Arthrobotrys entomopaga]